jgi:hypothetical protein
VKALKFLVFTIVVVLSVSLASIVLPLSAHETENKMLRQKIAELESRIQYLEALLKVYSGPDEAKNNPEYGWQNIKNWRKLKIGMTEEQVQIILGEPIKSIQGVRTLWYYPSIYRGYVSFDANGQLIGWMEP